MSEFSKKTEAEIMKMITEKREAMRAFRFGGAGSRTRDVRAGRTHRREVARMLTELKSRELAAKKETIDSKRDSR